MSTWSGAGIPVIGGQELSGAMHIIFKGSRYLVEHTVPGMEGGPVENLGKPQARIEIHGQFYQSGADIGLATLSGMIGFYNEIHVPSFNSGYYFIPSGTGVMFESLRTVYREAHGYPYYEWVLKGVLSGEVSLIPPPFVLSGQVGIDYSYSILVAIQGFTPFTDYSTNELVALYGYAPFVDYSSNLNSNVRGFVPFISYAVASGV